MIYYKCRITVRLSTEGVLWYYPEYKKHWWSLNWVNHHGWMDIKKAEMEIKAKLKIRKAKSKNKNNGNNSIGKTNQN